MNDIQASHLDDGKTERLGSSEKMPDVGQWFWVLNEDHEPKWFGCVIHRGSNYIELSGPANEGRGSHGLRVHVNDIATRLQHVPDYQRVLRARVGEAQDRVNALIAQFQELTRSLGVAPATGVENMMASSSTGLATMSGAPDISSYKTALIKAKEETIPELKNDLRSATETLSNWLQAETIPMTAMASHHTEVSDSIKDRIFSLELYAGLVESAHQFARGVPAAFDAKLHVFERMLYKDEECLLAMDDGGLDIHSLDQFQDWLARPENRDRLLPYERSLLAMRVRRTTKDRDSGGSIRQMLINYDLSLTDKYTYLYVRNGENLYCISTGIEFDETLFPSKAVFDPTEPMMIRASWHKVEDIMSRREYEDRCAELETKTHQRDQWNTDNPREVWEASNPGRTYEYANPFRYSEHSGFRPQDYSPFDHTNVFFDDGLKKVSDEIKKFNRVAVIIQGLFDRSDCLAPHKPVQTWTPQGFAESIELIYDGMGLTYGEPPAFEDYRKKCNALINENSILIGQRDAWLIREAEIECRRIDNDWRSKSDSYRPKRFQPYGDDGPGHLARPSKVMKRAGKAVFTWFRERRTRSKYVEPPIRATITVPFEELFNISAYRKGDYKMFFCDPRTRERYLEWAPLLMAAENYYLHGTAVQEPVE